jgi:V8-like Glu-specific endopeptidase
LVGREEIPGTGKMPKELDDLVRSNYLYLHSRGNAAPKLNPQPAVTAKDFSAWRVPLGPSVLEGIPGQALEQTAVGKLGVGPEDPQSQGSVRPNWATLSFFPRPGAARLPRFLRRRNGKRVVPEFVIGNDDRRIFYPNTWPWFCAGRIDVSCTYTFPWGEISSSWSGTGALVGKNVVLTASHVVPWGASTWTMKFMPGFYYNQNQTPLGSGVYSYTEKARGYPDHEQGDDMAVLKLYTPLGDSLGYFGYKTYNDDWEGGAYWTLIGYPGVVLGYATNGAFPTRQSGIVITDDDSDGAGVELEHNGDATDGNSGGPLWAWWGDSPRVIGTHSGSEYGAQTNNVAAGGSALAELIKWARDNW